MTTFEKVREVVSEKLGLDRSRVVEEAVFITDLAADSLDIVELRKSVLHTKSCSKQLLNFSEDFQAKTL